MTIVTVDTSWIESGALARLIDRGAQSQCRPGRRVEAAWMEVEGVRTYVRAGGPVPTPARLAVVLVHGFGVSGRYFGPTAWRLAREFPVYVPDLPGHGRSTLRGSVLDAVGLADALLAWIHTAGVGRVVLVGNSYGCQIAAHAAARAPGRVAGLVFIGPTLEPAYRSLPALLPRFIAALPHERPSILPMQALAFLRFGLHRLPLELRYMMRDRLEAVLPHVSVPALTIRGGNDRVVSQEWAERVTTLLRAGELRVLEGCGHALNYSAPGGLVRTMLPFLRAVARRPHVRDRRRSWDAPARRVPMARGR